MVSCILLHPTAVNSDWNFDSCVFYSCYTNINQTVHNDTHTHRHKQVYKIHKLLPLWLWLCIFKNKIRCQYNTFWVVAFVLFKPTVVKSFPFFDAVIESWNENSWHCLLKQHTFQNIMLSIYLTMIEEEEEELQEAI